MASASLKQLDGVQKAVEDVLNFVDKSGVFSLSRNHLQELEWAHYGGSHQGFCIGYDTQKLVEFDPATHQLLDVRYNDSAPTLSQEDLFLGDSALELLQKMLGVKSTRWSYEEEVRVVTQPPGPHQHDFRAVKEIYFGLRCLESTKFAVMETLAGRSIRYQQVVTSSAEYALSAIPVSDEFVSAPKYKANVAPINNGAISHDHLKAEQKLHARYLHMAAEIVRREPYCHEVELVDFSSSRSKPGNPIVFVQYRRVPNKSVNHYLTLPEIERDFAALGLPTGE